jgi:hypothetical protein
MKFQMEGVIKRYRIICEQLDAGSLSKRVLVLILGLLVIYLVWYFVFMSPVNKAKTQSKVQITQAKNQLTAVKLKVDIIVGDQKTGASQKKYNELTSQLDKLNKELKTYEDDMVPVSQMSRALREMLDTKQGLKLDNLQSLPTENIFSLSGKGEQEGLDLYQHSMKMTFHGDYFYTLNYLKHLENFKWQVFWDELIYTVDKYPSAKVEVTLHILNTQQEGAGAINQKGKDSE